MTERAAREFAVGTSKAQLKAEKYQRYLARVEAFELPDMKVAVHALHRRPRGLSLAEYDRRLTSQHGEDGLTVEIFRRIGIEHGRAVELGCGANGGNAGVMVAGLGCSGLLVDGNELWARNARRLYGEHGAQVECAWISAETVGGLLEAHGFDRELDYLGIDLDGIDLWVWKALDTRPRLVIAEFNPFFGPEACVTIPYAPDFDRTVRKDGRHIHPKGYFGAGIAALEHLAQAKGYHLIGSAPRSANAYFLRDDLDAGFPRVTAADAWRPLTKGRNKSAASSLRERIDAAGPQAYFEQLGHPLVDVGQS